MRPSRISHNKHTHTHTRARKGWKDACIHAVTACDGHESVQTLHSDGHYAPSEMMHQAHTCMHECTGCAACGRAYLHTCMLTHMEEEMFAVCVCVCVSHRHSREWSISSFRVTHV
jgi:hypothetical protein